jgi:hypothetical protein
MRASVDMISTIESGASGARLASYRASAAALTVSPEELLSTKISNGATQRVAFQKLSSKLTSFSEPELIWIDGLINIALARYRSG